MIVAIDLGGTRIKIGLVVGNNIIASISIEALSNNAMSQIIPRIEQQIASLFDSTNSMPHNITGIGIAFAGLVNTANNSVINSNGKYTDASSFDFVKWARDNYNVPLLMDNDARMACIGEWKHGAGIGCDNLVMVTLGTGIGTSAVINGQILRGAHFQAGILGGHLTTNINGNTCNCGNHGCSESEASSWVIEKMVHQHPNYESSLLKLENKIDIEAVFKLAGNNDVVAIAVRNHLLFVWACNIVNLIHAYDPEIIILAGGIMNSAETIMPYFNKHIEKFAWTPWGKPQIILAQNPSNAALLGSSYLLSNVNSLNYELYK